jgi:hypothetical protein
MALQITVGDVVQAVSGSIASQAAVVATVAHLVSSGIVPSGSATRRGCDRQHERERREQGRCQARDEKMRNLPEPSWPGATVLCVRAPQAGLRTSFTS